LARYQRSPNAFSFRQDAGSRLDKSEYVIALEFSSHYEKEAIVNSVELAVDDSRETIAALMNLREKIITSHPINNFIKHDITSLFKFFELYACFVYDFSGYVCELFSSLKDEKSKSFIYENLLDEMGHLEGKPFNWRNHHSELYRDLIRSMRNTEVYKVSIPAEETCVLEQKSREIADRFYAGHLEILRRNNDIQSIAAFSSIEGWVSKEYQLWQDCIVNFADVFTLIDVKTITLHCECDIGHSAVLDNLIRDFKETRVHEYDVKRGLLHGIVLAEHLFSDIMDQL
jgi:hypothetical protein